MSETWLTVVAPLSVGSWFTHFSKDLDAPLVVGEESDDPITLADRIEDYACGRSVRFHSGHDSLLRDWVASRELRRRAIEVESQSGMAVAAGIDKLLQKRLLALADIPTPAWGDVDAPGPANTCTLRKGRNSTQSRGLAWAAHQSVGATESYWETYVAGIEYSVVLYCGGIGLTVFPPVWKGRVRDDLLPPWRRLRLVPSGLTSGTELALQRTAAAVAQLIDAWGFVEVEFILTDDGVAVVIDVNPRICGTMRIVAMATETPIFDLSDVNRSGTRIESARRFAAEVPYSGVPFAAGGVIATSRLTCSASSPEAVRSTLATHGYTASDSDWPGAWCAN
ncbi:ATP-grasp domain-containing protein [Nocardia sp. CA-135953]|uniref:ATP-grasp domain-containing protein n=1 Tax=Nocardia sp. CA-135953 TaxID=3239978 RepID=UPI003D978811